jgi:hypothetical protein
LEHGEMLWFCRVPARAQEKDAKKWKFEKFLVQYVEFFIIWRLPFPDKVAACGQGQHGSV